MTQRELTIKKKTIEQQIEMAEKRVREAKEDDNFAEALTQEYYTNGLKMALTILKITI